MLPRKRRRSFLENVFSRREGSAIQSFFLSLLLDVIFCNIKPNTVKADAGPSVGKLI